MQFLESLRQFILKRDSNKEKTEPRTSYGMDDEISKASKKARETLKEKIGSPSGRDCEAELSCTREVLELMIAQIRDEVIRTESLNAAKQAQQGQ